MSERTIGVLAMIGLAVFGTVLYVRHLADVPPHLMHDEAQFALQAQSVAASGRDMAGRFLPVYFSEPEFPAGRDPVIIYATAAVLRVVPFGEDSARLATAMTGVLNIVLMFLVVRALFGSPTLGVIAAMMLALTPAHFIRARLVLSPFFSIPFILLWLWALIAYERQPGVRRVALAGAWLGLGVYTYLACVILMPVYLAASVAFVLRRGDARGAGALVAGFAVVLLPMALWYAGHPERFSQIFGSYREFSTAPPAMSLAGIQARAALYWSFFDPAFLFVSGDSSLVNSTRRAGFFPMAFAILLPVGLYWIARSRQPLYWIAGGGFLLAPLAAVISGAIEMNRLMFAIPFGVLVAVIGAAMLLGGRAGERVLAFVLLASIPLQFSHFHADYSSRYRDTVGSWFGGNIAGAYRPVIAGEPHGGSGHVYVSARIPMAQRYWRFYALESGRPDLIGAPHYVTDMPPNAPPGARWICPAAESACQTAAASGEWRKELSAGEPGQAPAFDVFIREPAE